MSTDAVQPVSQDAQAADATTGSAPKPSVDSTTQPSAVKLFDRHNKFSTVIQDPAAADGKKTCLVRFPTDDEWCARAKQLVTIRKTLDQGRAKTETPREAEISQRLFEKIRLDTGPAFDEAEAFRVVERLARCVPTACERHGIQYTITMRTFNGVEVVHVFKMPSQKQLMDFNRATVQITSVRHTIETRIALEPFRDLWAALVVDWTGYAPDTSTTANAKPAPPIVHMVSAIDELLAQVTKDAEDLESDPED